MTRETEQTQATETITISRLLQLLNCLAPFDTAEDFDNVGLLFGNPAASLCRGILCVDITPAVVKQAQTEQAQVIISHHPLIFHGLKRIETESSVETLLRQQIAVIACHTNWDNAAGGVEDTLADTLQLTQAQPLGASGQGRVGFLPSPMSPEDFYGYLCRQLSINHLRMVAGKRLVQRVVTLCGCGESGMQAAASSGADAVVTGEMRHQYFTDHLHTGMTLAAVGHFESEKPGMLAMLQLLRQKLPQVDWQFSTEASPFFASQH